MATEPMLRMSPEIGALMTAMIAFRGMVGTMARNKGVDVQHKAGGKHEFKYTTADEQFEATLEPLTTCGLAVSQPPDGLAVWTLITHAASGQWIAGLTPILSVSAGMQGYNAALSSARRVGFSSILGLVSGDKEEATGYDARKARTPRVGKKEQPSAEVYLRAIHDATDVQAAKVAIGMGRLALEGWPSAELIESAGVEWFRRAIDGTSDRAALDAIQVTLTELHLANARSILATSFRAAGGRVAKAGQVPE